MVLFENQCHHWQSRSSFSTLPCTSTWFLAAGATRRVDAGTNAVVMPAIATESGKGLKGCDFGNGWKLTEVI